MDPFLAYCAKAEADFRTALENLTRARKVYASFLASRETAAVARDTVPGDGGGTAVNALAAKPAAVATPETRNAPANQGVSNVLHVSGGVEDLASAGHGGLPGDVRSGSNTVACDESVRSDAALVNKEGNSQLQAGNRGSAPAERAEDDLTIPPFLDRRKGTGSAGAEHPPVNATDGAL